MSIYKTYKLTVKKGFSADWSRIMWKGLVRNLVQNY